MLDLVLLGIGEDGHTASLFPGTTALDERTQWVVMNDVPQLHTRRMTLTYPVLNAAERVWVLIAGAGKRPMVTECLAAAARNETPRPILGVRPTAGELVWFLDAAAAPATKPVGVTRVAAKPRQDGAALQCRGEHDADMDLRIASLHVCAFRPAVAAVRSNAHAKALCLRVRDNG